MTQSYQHSDNFPQIGGIQSPVGMPIHLGEVIARLNSLLRVEISAAETFRSAMDKLADSKPPTQQNVGLLRDVRNEHTRCANALRERIYELGGDPVESSGPWGVWARFTIGAAKLLGDISTLKSLKEAEEHGLKEYQYSLSELDSLSCDLIESRLIPNRQKHIKLIEQLMQSASASH